VKPLFAGTDSLSKLTSLTHPIHHVRDTSREQHDRFSSISLHLYRWGNRPAWWWRLNFDDSVVGLRTGFHPEGGNHRKFVVVGVTALFGLISHARAGRVQWRTGLIFGGAGMTGAFIGGQIGSQLPGALLLGAFSVMMAVTAVAMLRGRKSVAGSHHKGLPIFRIILDGLVVGLVTGLVGAGGGFLVVPALALLGGLPMPIAVATSLLVVAMKSFAGFAGYALQFGNGSFVSLNPEPKSTGA